MPQAHVKFWEDPRELTEEQIAELHAGNLLRDDPPVPSAAARRASVNAPEVSAVAPASSSEPAE